MKRLLLLCLLLVRPVQAQQTKIYLPLIIVVKPLPLKGVGATYDADVGDLWCHDWSLDPDCSDYSFPTIWGRGSVDKKLGGTVKVAILFNEPEVQSNIEPIEGAHLTCLAVDNNPTYEFTTPSASTAWLNAWWAELENSCPQHLSKITWVNHHCYGSYDAGYATARCKGLYESYKRWGDERNISKHIVTEFAHLPCWGAGIEGSVTFLQAMKEFYEENKVLYAWFQYSYLGTEPWAFGPFCNTSLVDYETGEITELGVAYMED